MTTSNSLRSRLQLCALVLALGLPHATAAKGAASPRLLLTGSFHGEEVVSRSGEEWLALVPDAAGGFELVRCTIDVSAVEDPIMDEEGEATGKKVEVSIERQPLFLVRESERVKPGRVPTIVSRAVAVTRDSPLPLELTAGDSARLLLSFREAGQDGGSDCSVSLVLGGRTQVLGGFSHCDREHGTILEGDEGLPRLKWVGDLDHDGRVDLLLDLTRDDNAGDVTLLLSSEAKSGDLVGVAGRFQFVGC